MKVWRYISTHSYPQYKLDGGEWWVSRSDALNRGEKFPRYPLKRKLGGPKAGLDVLTRKMSCLCRKTNHNSEIVHT
jgi:hypothetical protein